MSAPTIADVPDVGRVILECLRSLPYPLGRTGVAKVLPGAADSPVPADRCDHHGALAGFTLKSLREFTDTLVTQKLLFLDREAEYPLLTLTEAGRDALREQETVLANPLRSAASARTSSLPQSARPSASGAAPTRQNDAPLDADEDDRFERLRAWRRIEAERLKLPPYVIFHDATLRSIAQMNPAHLEEMNHIPGIGPHKLESYGEAVIDLLQGEIGLTQGDTRPDAFVFSRYASPILLLTSALLKPLSRIQWNVFGKTRYILGSTNHILTGEITMQYVNLGRTALKVSRLCLGTMNFGPQTTEPDSYAIMDHALEVGVNFFDTANVYGWKRARALRSRSWGAGGRRAEDGATKW